MPTLKAGLSRSTQLPRRIYFYGQKNGGFQLCCLIQYGKISCCHAATACYSSLGQLLAPELSEPWFRGDSLVEQGRFWWLQILVATEGGQASKWAPPSNTAKSSTRNNQVVWDWQVFQVEMTSCSSRKKHEKIPASIGAVLKSLKVSPGFCCLPQAFPAETWALRCLPSYKWSAWKSNTRWTNTQANKPFFVLWTVGRLCTEKHAHFQLQADRCESRNKFGLLISYPTTKTVMFFLFCLKTSIQSHLVSTGTRRCQLICSPWSHRQCSCKAPALLHLKLASSHGYNS